MDQPIYTHQRFIADAQKQLVNVALATLSDRTLDWAQVAPFLDAARALCREEFGRAGTLAIHGTEYLDGNLVPAEEAYLSISVRDGENETEWLAQTHWLSDLALADQDPDRVRNAIAALEASLEKLRAWLAEQETAAPGPEEEIST
jgi:hypothetical protein